MRNPASWAADCPRARLARRLPRTGESLGVARFRIGIMAIQPYLGLSAWGETPQQRGAAVLADPLLNKGTAFTDRERDALGLRGLLPPRVFTMDEQVQRSLGAVRRAKATGDLPEHALMPMLQAL